MREDNRSKTLAELLGLKGRIAEMICVIEVQRIINICYVHFRNTQCCGLIYVCVSYLRSQPHCRNCRTVEKRFPLDHNRHSHQVKFAQTRKRFVGVEAPKLISGHL